MQDDARDALVDGGRANGVAAGHAGSPIEHLCRVDFREAGGKVEDIEVVARLQPWVNLLTRSAFAVAPASVVVCQNTKAGRLETFSEIREEMQAKATELDVNNGVSA